MRAAIVSKLTNLAYLSTLRIILTLYVYILQNSLFAGAAAPSPRTIRGVTLEQFF